MIYDSNYQKWFDARVKRNYPVVVPTIVSWRWEFIGTQDGQVIRYMSKCIEASYSVAFRQAATEFVRQFPRVKVEAIECK